MHDARSADSIGYVDKLLAMMVFCFDDQSRLKADSAVCIDINCQDNLLEVAIRVACSSNKRTSNSISISISGAKVA